MFFQHVLFGGLLAVMPAANAVLMDVINYSGTHCNGTAIEITRMDGANMVCNTPCLSNGPGSTRYMCLPVQSWNFPLLGVNSSDNYALLDYRPKAQCIANATQQQYRIADGRCHPRSNGEFQITTCDAGVTRLAVCTDPTCSNCPYPIIGETGTCWAEFYTLSCLKIKNATSPPALPAPRIHQAAYFDRPGCEGSPGYMYRFPNTGYDSNSCMGLNTTCQKSGSMYALFSCAANLTSPLPPYMGTPPFVAAEQLTNQTTCTGDVTGRAIFRNGYCHPIGPGSSTFQKLECDGLRVRIQWCSDSMCTTGCGDILNIVENTCGTSFSGSRYSCVLPVGYTLPNVSSLLPPPSPPPEITEISVWAANTCEGDPITTSVYVNPGQSPCSVMASYGCVPNGVGSNLSARAFCRQSMSDANITKWRNPNPVVRLDTFDNVTSCDGALGARQWFRADGKCSLTFVNSGIKYVKAALGDNAVRVEECSDEACSQNCRVLFDGAPSICGGTTSKTQLTLINPPQPQPKPLTTSSSILPAMNSATSTTTQASEDATTALNLGLNSNWIIIITASGAGLALAVVGALVLHWRRLNAQSSR